MSYNFKVKDAGDFHERVQKVHEILTPPSGKVQGRVSTKLEPKNKKTFGDRLPFLEKILSMLGLYIMSRTDSPSVAYALENFATCYAPGRSKGKIPKEGYISIADKNTLLECIKKLSDQATKAGIKNLKVFEKAHATISAITIPENHPSKPVNPPPPKPGPDPKPVSNPKPVDEKDQEKPNLEKQLQDALKSKDFDTVRSLVKQSPAEAFNGTFPKEKFLSDLLEDKQLDIAELLLTKGFHPPSLSQLISNIKQDNLDAAEFVLKHSKFTMENVLKEESADVKTVKFLIQKGIAAENKHLLIAVDCKHVDIAEFFINENKVNVNEIFFSQGNPNVKWVQKNVDFLLDHGADVNFGDRKDLTPFYRKIRNHDFDIAQDFINRGGDLQHMDKSGKTLLSYTIQDRNLEGFEFVINERIKKYGLQAGLTLGVNNLNHSPLYMLGCYDYGIRGEQMIDFLLKKGADINTPNVGTNHETPLYGAIEVGNFNNVCRLIKWYKATVGLDEESKMALLAKAKANSKYEKAHSKYEKADGYVYSRKEIDRLTKILKLNVIHKTT
ncbi:MAG: hypothetical protein IM550_14925 [Microcystis sp. M54BS1]|nr:hypothetical protein [Microcystis sp. M54BS1]